MEGATGGVIGRNILINALGGSWSAILALLIIPIQIRVLGADAYGLIAFVAALQLIVSVFDLGLSPTIAREVATDTSPDLRYSRDLLQTLAAGYAVVGLFLGAALFLSADWLVNRWLNLGGLPVASARSAVQFAALAVMLRWPVSFYAGVITGRGRFDVLNGLKAGAATFGLLGGAVAILISQNLVVFTAWMALSALVEVTLYLVACFRLVPGLSLRPRVSRPALAQVWRSALGVSVIGVLSIALTQADRLILGRLVTIEAVGYYSLAYNVLAGLTLVQTWITSAMFPVFAADHGRGQLDALATHYRRATQALLFVYTLPIALFVFFGHDLLRLWTSAEVAAAASRIMAVLAVGFLLSASIAVSASMAIAIKNTRMLIVVIAGSIVVYLPGLYLLIGRWGGLGAAAAWVLLNASYVVSWLPFFHKNILRSSMGAWLGGACLPFVGCGAVSFGLGRGVLSVMGWHQPAAAWAMGALAVPVYGALGYRFLDPPLRGTIAASFRQTAARMTGGG